jgi:D-tyrosyl-tRNA(Tyr) deacylase
VRAVVQRVSSASVEVDGRIVGRIGPGLLAFVGVERGDGQADAEYIAGKIRDLRVFEEPADPAKRLNRSVQEIGGAVLVVSQFTLTADCRKGRRPSFDAAEAPQIARPLVDQVADLLRQSGVTVETGEFQATMKVALVNEGPVTLLLDSRKNI